MNSSLSELIDGFCNLFKSFKINCSDLDVSNIDETARIEIGMFMMYLSASDGIIQWDEVKLISDVCKLNLSPDSLSQFIEENNIYSTEFEKKVPLTFRIMVQADNQLSELITPETSLSETMLTVYKLIGTELIESDGDIDNDELNNYNIYINMLTDYRNKNLIKANHAVSGLTKNSSQIKHGVVAPKKG